MIDTTHIGTTFGPYTYDVEREHIRAMAAVVGERNPIFHEVAAARAAGLPDLPAPPTLPTRFSLWASEDLISGLIALSGPLEHMLHGEQEYHYYAPVYAGDTLTVTPRIADIRQKRGASGGFALVTLASEFVSARAGPAWTERLVVVVRESVEPAPPPDRPANGRELPAPPPGTEALPTIIDGPIIHNRLVRYSGASGDFNPLHTDRIFAQRGGLDDVIAHGMLVMGIAGRMLSARFGVGQLRRYMVRFRGMTRLGETISCGGAITGTLEAAGEQRLSGELYAAGDGGDLKLSGAFEAAQ